MITITENATRKVYRHLGDTNYVGIRLSLDDSGCAGYQYKLTYVHPDQLNSTDIGIPHSEFRVFIDARYVDKLCGTVIDYVEDGLSGKFEYFNPNVKDQCGCGESFTTN